MVGECGFRPIRRQTGGFGGVGVGRRERERERGGRRRRRRWRVVRRGRRRVVWRGGVGFGIFGGGWGRGRDVGTVTSNAEL